MFSKVSPFPHTLNRAMAELCMADDCLAGLLKPVDTWEANNVPNRWFVEASAVTL